MLQLAGAIRQARHEEGLQAWIADLKTAESMAAAVQRIRHQLDADQTALDPPTQALNAQLGQYLADGKPFGEIIDDLLDQRQQARAAKEFARADAIRKRLVEWEIEVQDRPGGKSAWTLRTKA